jgi:hypothetical protein
MATGRLPRAPICRDVQQLTPEWLADNQQQEQERDGGPPGEEAPASTALSDAGQHAVDMIVAGFPCPGFSSAGQGAGFNHEETALFREASATGGGQAVDPVAASTADAPARLCDIQQHQGDASLGGGTRDRGPRFEGLCFATLCRTGYASHMHARAQALVHP